MTEVRKPKSQRNYNCVECSTPYTALKYVAKLQRYCSAFCKQSHHRLKQQKKDNKKVARRRTKLSSSEEWLWISKECRRAGTVEIMSQHTAETLEQLFALRNYKYRCWGWCGDRKTDYYHLCHIQPVKGNGTVGLLHPLNLFVGRSSHNQSQSNDTVHSRAGISINENSLLTKWKIKDTDADAFILVKVVKFLGAALDAYLNNNAVTTARRLTLAKWVFQHQYEFDATGYDDTDPVITLFKVGFTLKQLQGMNVSKLREIRSLIEMKETFKRDLYRKRSIVVYRDEIARLAEMLPHGEHKSNCSTVLPMLNLSCMLLANYDEGIRAYQPNGLQAYQVAYPLKGQLVSDSTSITQLGTLCDEEIEDQRSRLRDWITLTAFNTLQGNDVKSAESLYRTFTKYVDRSTSKIEVSTYGSLWKTEVPDAEQFVKSAYADMLTVGLLNVDTHRIATNSFKNNLRIERDRILIQEAKSNWYDRNYTPGDFLIRTDLDDKSDRDNIIAA